MKIPHDYDVVSKGAPSFSSGTDPFNNPQIQPASSPSNEVKPMVNSQTPNYTSKAPPSGKKGSGYNS
jgi:hypothetical protein